MTVSPNPDPERPGARAVTVDSMECHSRPRMTDRPEIARARPDSSTPTDAPVRSGQSIRGASHRIGWERFGTSRAPPIAGTRPLATHQRCGVRCGVARRRERETSRVESVIPDPRSIAYAHRMCSRLFVIVGLNPDRSDARRNRLNGSRRSPRLRGESTGERSVAPDEGRKCPDRPVRGDETRKIPTISQRKALVA